MGLFKWLYKTMDQDKKKKDNGLMPREQDEIDKGDYESFNFEEEDLEDDDYYNEDDDN